MPDFDVDFVFTYNIPSNKHRKTISMNVCGLQDVVDRTTQMFPTVEEVKITDRDTKQSWEFVRNGMTSYWNSK